MDNEEVKVVEGAFLESLKRNNSKIKSDRATAIAEDAQTTFKREIEDLEISIKRMKRERENLLDMSPDNALSLKLASDFDAKEFVATERNLAVKIRDTEVVLGLLKERYDHLFGAM